MQGFTLSAKALLTAYSHTVPILQLHLLPIHPLSGLSILRTYPLPLVLVTHRLASSRAQETRTPATSKRAILHPTALKPCSQTTMTSCFFFCPARLPRSWALTYPSYRVISLSSWLGPSFLFLPTVFLLLYPLCSAVQRSAVIHFVLGGNRK